MYTEDQENTGQWIRSKAEMSSYGWKAFYKTYRWITMRRRILTRDRNACVMCRRKGRYTRAAVVHHIKHLKDCPELALSPDNLISLCERCHEEVHPEKKKYRKKKFVNVERW